MSGLTRPTPSDPGSAVLRFMCVEATRLYSSILFIYAFCVVRVGVGCGAAVGPGVAGGQHFQGCVQAANRQNARQLHHQHGPFELQASLQRQSLPGGHQLA